MVPSRDRSHLSNPTYHRDENLQVRSRVAKLLETVEAGEPIYTGMQRIGMFPDLVINMFETGEIGGKLEETLGKVIFLAPEHRWGHNGKRND